MIYILQFVIHGSSYHSDAGVLVCGAKEWASQTVKVGEQGTGFYLEIQWKDRASGLRQEGTRESVVVRCLGGFIGSWGFFENKKKLRGVNLLSVLWILRINLTQVTSSDDFSLRYQHLGLGAYETRPPAQPPRWAEYCLLKSKLRISNVLTSWVLKCNLIFKVESFLPFIVLFMPGLTC